MPETTVLRARGLGYRYPCGREPALREVDLTVRAGEFVVLAGESASGKSTLLQAACGLVPHFHGGEIRGELAVGGLDVRAHGPAELAPAVGFVSQSPESQVVSTTVSAEVELPLELRGQPPPARARAVEEVALALGIAELLPRTTATLSGGELQRVALAAALVSRPALVLLDEPTSQLDPVAGDELVWLLRRLNEQWGVAVVLCEHRLERCLAAADRVVAMTAGAIGFDGPPGDFLEWAIRDQPVLATPAARLFDAVGLRPLPTGVKQAREILVGARPEDASSAGGRGSAASARPWQTTQLAEAGPLTGPAAERPGPAGKRFAALSTRDLWVELDRGDEIVEVLSGVDLEVGAGERVALMGRNGAGKSTLLRTAAGLVSPARGRLETPGGCALLGQDPGDYLVRERVGDELPGAAGKEALSVFALDRLADADPRDLSGGERQRLALAIVLAGRAPGDGAPGLVCLDEPTRGMDRARKADLASLASRLALAGSAVVIATHDVEFAVEFADRVVLLGAGEVLADASCEEVLAGGWYFTTEVARITGGAAIGVERGAALLAPSAAAGSALAGRAQR